MYVLYTLRCNLKFASTLKRSFNFYCVLSDIFYLSLSPSKAFVTFELTPNCTSADFYL